MTARFMSLIRKRPAFLAALAVLFLVGVALVLLGGSDLLGHDEKNLWRNLLHSLGEAFVIASFLALLVDPLAQHQFATRVGTRPVLGHI